MKKLLSLLAAVGVMFALSSCGDDDDGPAPVGGLAITGIPANASVTAGETLTVSNVSLSFEDGFGSFEVELNGATTVDLSALVTDPSATSASALTITFDTDESLIGTNTLVFTLADADGDEVNFTHTLVVEAIVPTFTVQDATEQRGPDEDNTVPYPQNEVTGIINTDYTFTNDVVWVLNGRVIVDAGSALTIEEGTIIKGTTGQGALSSVLLVASGATINAVGTSASPIVMTSIEDNINIAGNAYYEPNDNVIIPGTDPSADGFTSTLDVDLDIGKWGGLIILGDAPISADGATTVIEGIPSSVSQAVYGGSNAEHNAGIVRYVSIRFTGTQLGPGNELQGLTLGGVGSGTEINWVESIASADDGVEIFGGTVNLSNFIVWGQEDDGYDTDQAWTGTVDNFVYLGTNATADHAFELDGPEGSSKGVGNFTNGIVWGANSSGMADFRDDSEHDLSNIFFFNFNDGGDADIELDAGDADDETENSDNYLTDGTIVLENLQFRDNDRTDLASIMDDKLAATAAASDTKFAEAGNSNSVISGDPTVGADVSGFGWSYTSKKFAGWSTVVDAGQ